LSIGDITLAEPEPGTYDLVLGNCSLEHIPDIREALVRMHKGLKPDGQLILFVPAPQWTRNLALVRGFGHLGHRAEMALGYAIDGFFQHHHLYGHPVWAGLLASLGYRNIRASGLGGERLNQFFARNLLAAAPEFVFKTATDHYPGPIFRRRGLSASCLEELRALPLPPNDPRVVEYAILADRNPA
jgi:SAM-dependent methyltransferase